MLMLHPVFHSADPLIVTFYAFTIIVMSMLSVSKDTDLQTEEHVTVV